MMIVIARAVLVRLIVAAAERVVVVAARIEAARVFRASREPGAEQKEAARSLGAAKIVDVDDPEEIRRFAPYDVVADTIGGEVAGQLVALVKDRGVFASVLGEPPNKESRQDVRFAAMMAHPDPETLARVAEDVKAGELAIPIGVMTESSAARYSNSFSGATVRR